jgi:hypothetical protein
VLVGAELGGIPEELIAEAATVVQIPQWGLVPSLNLAVAGSIVVYDYLQAPPPGRWSAGRGKADEVGCRACEIDPGAAAVARARVNERNGKRGRSLRLTASGHWQQTGPHLRSGSQILLQ